MDILVTYSLLSTIKEKKQNLTTLIDVYKELTEGLLAEMNIETNGKGLLDDLKKEFDSRYTISIPFPTLKIILTMISKEKASFQLFSDFCFIHDTNDFEDLKTIIDQETDIVQEIKAIYKELCHESGIDHCIGLDYFINLNRKELIAYINNQNNQINNDKEFEVFRTLYRMDKFKDLIDKLVLGSIMSAYVEFDFAEKIKKKTLLLDTNFIVSLLDLHSIESKTTCNEIISIAKKCKFSIEVLPETVKEVQNLLHRKSYSVDKPKIFTSRDTHTIESGCNRKNINGHDLNLISSKVEQYLRGQGIIILSQSENTKLRRNAKKTEFFEKMKDRPFNKEGIIHDVMAMSYIKGIRKENEIGFSNTTAFFVTDTQGFVEKKISSETELPYLITAEELLNILWLLNPISNTLITSTNISNIFSKYLQKNLPDRKMLAAMDKKIQSLEEIPIDVKDCAEIATNISVKDTQAIKEFTEASDLPSLKEKLEYLAQIAEKNKKSEIKDSIDKSNKLLGIVSSKLTKEKKEVDRSKSKINMFEKQIEEKDSTFEKYKKTMSNQISEIENQKIRSELSLKRNYLKNRIDSDNEELEIHNDDIEKIKKSISDQIFVSTLILSIIIISIIIGLGISFLIPNWEIIEPITYILGISLAFIVFIAKKIFPQFREIKIMQIIVLKVRVRSAKKLEKLYARKSILESRIIQNTTEMNNIII